MGTTIQIVTYSCGVTHMLIISRLVFDLLFAVIVPYYTVKLRLLSGGGEVCVFQVHGVCMTHSLPLLLPVECVLEGVTVKVNTRFSIFPQLGHCDLYPLLFIL